VGFSDQQKRYEIFFSLRQPYIHDEISREIKRGFSNSSRKISFKFSQIFENTISFNDVFEGKFSELKL
jgi:hypothetical protein